MEDKFDKKNTLNVNEGKLEEDNQSNGVYRVINENNCVEKIQLNSGTENGTKMVQDENAINDGADEQMLGAEDKGKLTEKREEVKFIKGDHQNGDAKIDISVTNGKTFTGMTKEELMKYANDPFWVRLRWIFFIGFWGIWVAMLVGAIYIIIQSEKCSAPEPLPWYKRGPLAKFKSVETFDDNDVAAARKIRATGAIYELPAEFTYSISDPNVEEKIKNVIAKYKDSEVNVILDITPNYVNKESALMKNALEDESKRSPFIWIKQKQVPNNWLSVKNGTAWDEIQPGNYVLSQFGDGLYDLQMNDTIVRKELEASFKHLIDIGVKGFRLKNTKFFLLSKNIQSESVGPDHGYDHTDYRFWTHSHTVFQDGLGNILDEYSKAVKNMSANAFVSVADDLLRPESYQTINNTLSVELPIYGRFLHYVGTNEGDKLEKEMNNTMQGLGNHSWVQWDFKDLAERNSNNDPSAIALFVSLLPGVPVMSMDDETFFNVSADVFNHINHIRESQSYMHGDFRMYSYNNLVAYSRIKSGNPGYFVVYNPTETMIPGNFTSMGLPEKMTVDAVSENCNGISVRAKLTINSIELSPYSTIILTYVPL